MHTCGVKALWILGGGLCDLIDAQQCSKYFLWDAMMRQHSKEEALPLGLHKRKVTNYAHVFKTQSQNDCSYAQVFRDGHQSNSLLALGVRRPPTIVHVPVTSSSVAALLLFSLLLLLLRHRRPDLVHVPELLGPVVTEHMCTRFCGFFLCQVFLWRKI